MESPLAACSRLTSPSGAAPARCQPLPRRGRNEATWKTVAASESDSTARVRTRFAPPDIFRPTKQKPDIYKETRPSAAVNPFRAEDSANTSPTAPYPTGRLTRRTGVLPSIPANPRQHKKREAIQDWTGRPLLTDHQVTWHVAAQSRAPVGWSSLATSLTDSSEASVGAVSLTRRGQPGVPHTRALTRSRWSVG